MVNCSVNVADFICYAVFSSISGLQRHIWGTIELRTCEISWRQIWGLWFEAPLCFLSCKTNLWIPVHLDNHMKGRKLHTLPRNRLNTLPPTSALCTKHFHAMEQTCHITKQSYCYGKNAIWLIKTLWPVSIQGITQNPLCFQGHQGDIPDCQKVQGMRLRHSVTVCGHCTPRLLYHLLWRVAPWRKTFIVIKWTMLQLPNVTNLQMSIKVRMR